MHNYPKMYGFNPKNQMYKYYLLIGVMRNLFNLWVCITDYCRQYLLAHSKEDAYMRPYIIER